MKRYGQVADKSSDNIKNGCKKCPFVKMYDYGKVIYYCDHGGREDDMGKVGEGELPEKRPMWCPLI